MVELLMVSVIGTVGAGPEKLTAKAVIGCCPEGIAVLTVEGVDVVDTVTCSAVENAPDGTLN